MAEYSFPYKHLRAEGKAGEAAFCFVTEAKTPAIAIREAFGMEIAEPCEGMDLEIRGLAVEQRTAVIAGPATHTDSSSYKQQLLLPRFGWVGQRTLGRSIIRSWMLYYWGA